MIIYIIIGCIVAVVGIIVIYSKINIRIKLLKEGKNEKVKIDVNGLFGMLDFKKEYPLFFFKGEKEGSDSSHNEKNKEKKYPTKKKQLKLNKEEVFGNFPKYKEAITYIKEKVRFENCISHLFISSEDVFVTIFSFNLVNAIHKYMYDNLDAKTMSLEVIPGFSENQLKADIDLSIYFRVYNFLHLLKYYKIIKIEKGGV